ncbi:hypothetical protein [Candidatus Palauibacter sp.]|uniref:hypothetical protein n=1 Tax=Candidatus Palauibacter sp. TaxID=3101350 RepID=UPI003B516C50
MWGDDSSRLATRHTPQSIRIARRDGCFSAADRAAAEAGLALVPEFLRWSPGGTSGSDLHTADNPDFGVTFAYYVDETLRTREAARQ